MTCIAGLVHEGDVWIGADSSSIGDGELTIREDSKVFHRREYLIGYTSSWRMGQLIEHAFDPPALPQVDREQILGHLVRDFIPALRECLKAGGFTKVEHSQETGGRFLLGCRGRLFRVDSDFHVGEARDLYDACGGGASVALGSLYTTAGEPNPERRVMLALLAAERWSIYVRGPFRILSTRRVES